MRIDQVADRLRDRFALLTRGSRTALERHQTLRSLIDWSHELLAEPEKVLLRRLSVFAGGWTLEAAESACAGDGLTAGDILEVLAALVEKSLVMLDTKASQPRYRMLVPIREFALERLAGGRGLDGGGEAEALRARHAAYFLALAERAEPELRGPRQAAWIDRLEIEYDNLHAALDWSAASPEGVETGLRIGTVTRRLVAWRDHPGRLSRVDARYAQDRFTACKADFLARGFLAASASFVLWGFGATGKALARALEARGRRISRIVEVHPRRIGQRIRGVPVVGLEELARLKGEPLVVSVAGAGPRAEIRAHLQGQGFRELRDYICAA